MAKLLTAVLIGGIRGTKTERADMVAMRDFWSSVHGICLTKVGKASLRPCTPDNMFWKLLSRSAMGEVQNKVKGLLKGYNAALQTDGCARMAMVTQILQSATQTKAEQMFAHNSDSLEAMREMHVMIAIDVKSMFTATDI